MLKIKISALGAAVFLGDYFGVSAAATPPTMTAGEVATFSRSACTHSVGTGAATARFVPFFAVIGVQMARIEGKISL